MRSRKNAGPLQQINMVNCVFACANPRIRDRLLFNDAQPTPQNTIDVMIWTIWRLCNHVYPVQSSYLVCGPCPSCSPICPYTCPATANTAYRRDHIYGPIITAACAPLARSTLARSGKQYSSRVRHNMWNEELITPNSRAPQHLLPGHPSFGAHTVTKAQSHSCANKHNCTDVYVSKVC